MRGKYVICFIYLSSILIELAAAAGGVFTVNCAPLTIQRSDPIIQPGIASSHVHSVVGGNAFKRSMPGKMDPQSANATTCNKALDHSNYWVPQLYHFTDKGEFEIVKFTGSATYYLKRACDYAPGLKSCDADNFPQIAPPFGFRMVAGDPYRRTQNNSDFAQKAIDIVCLGGTSPEQAGFPTSRCNSFRAQVFFPSCWDGVNLDTPDHKSHVAYPAYGDFNFGVCPQSHPKAIFSVFYEFGFDTSPYTDIDRFAFANGDPTGYGFHGDYMMGWTDYALFQSAHQDCENAIDCPKLGMQPAVPQPLIYPAPNDEDIGLNGPIPLLPGNNSIPYWPKRG